MKREVRFTDQADQQLAAIWMADSNRDDVTAAANRIEATLERDPLGAGEARADGDRILFDAPLVVYYRLDPVSGDVWVVSLGRTN
jgi:hypothetical protein